MYRESGAFNSSSKQVHQLRVFKQIPGQRFQTRDFWTRVLMYSVGATRKKHRISPATDRAKSFPLHSQIITDSGSPFSVDGRHGFPRSA